MTQLKENSDRFNGIAEIYDKARPKTPNYVTEFLIRYLGYKPEVVVDIGCGTGLSTFAWRDKADKIYGVDPNKEMLLQAKKKVKEIDSIEFIEAFSTSTGIKDGIADIVTCSQSFHWMEPVSTLKEVNRILKSNGIFAVYDSDWPPICNSVLDYEYQSLDELTEDIEIDVSHFIRYPKDQHLQNIKNSGYFKYSREVVFAATEYYDSIRYFNLMLSQGSTQVVLRKNPERIEGSLARFKEIVEEIYDDKTLPVEFSYRMRFGVKI